MIKDKLKAVRKRRYILAILLLFVIAIRYISHGGEFYARNLYPAISFAQSLISSISPVSLDELIVAGWILTLLIYPFYAHKKKAGIKHILGMEAEFVCWIFVWFYMGWACNYYRDDIYTRASKAPAQVDSLEFIRFLNNYTEKLNASYIKVEELEKEKTISEIKELYRNVPEHFGLTEPKSFQNPKYLLFNKLYSSVAVGGYIGPFASESHVNNQTLISEYPFVYAHELSHLLGVSNEGEANYWAYRICIKASSSEIRYAGYYCIFPNVARTAMTILSEDDYRKWIETIDPRIIEERSEHDRFWSEQMSEWIYDTQRHFYNLFLKSNRIYSGTKNYDTVVQIIISLDA